MFSLFLSLKALDNIKEMCGGNYSKDTAEFEMNWNFVNEFTWLAYNNLLICSLIITANSSWKSKFTIHRFVSSKHCDKNHFGSIFDTLWKPKPIKLISIFHSPENIPLISPLWSVHNLHWLFMFPLSDSVIHILTKARTEILKLLHWIQGLAPIPLTRCLHRYF